MLWYCLLIVMAALYYILLITNGNFDFMQSTYLGMTFNSMLEHLLRGEFNVAPDAVKVEGFTRNGKTYSYFGVAPALLRLPLLAGGSVSQYDLTRLYCALAATLGLCFKLASVALINGELPKKLTPGDRLFRARAVGAIRRRSIQFLRSSIYQETIEWAGVLAAAFVYCSLRGLIRSRGFSTDSVLKVQQ